MGVVGLQLFYFDPGTEQAHTQTHNSYTRDWWEGGLWAHSAEVPHRLLDTYWSSVPKNFTKWHFLPLGFFRSLGGLTIWNVNRGFGRALAQSLSCKCWDLFSFKSLTSYLSWPWWVTPKLPPERREIHLVISYLSHFIKQCFLSVQFQLTNYITFSYNWVLNLSKFLVPTKKFQRVLKTVMYNKLESSVQILIALFMKFLHDSLSLVFSQC